MVEYNVIIKNYNGFLLCGLCTSFYTAKIRTLFNDSHQSYDALIIKYICVGQIFSLEDESRSDG